MDFTARLITTRSRGTPKDWSWCCMAVPRAETAPR